MERTLRKVRVYRIAHPLNTDNFLKKGWLKRLGGTVGKVVGTVTGKPGLVQTSSALLEKGRAERATVNAKKAANKTVASGNLGTVDLSMPEKVSAPFNAGDRIKKVAGEMPASKVSKGQKILETGLGILTEGQKALQKGQTDPSRLPKTKALKEAEQKLLLPQRMSGAASVADTITGIDKKWLIIGGVVLAIGLVTFFMLRK